MLFLLFLNRVRAPSFDLFSYSRNIMDLFPDWSLKPSESLKRAFLRGVAP